ncbi:unnamed protein product, partial [Linum tenue]
MGKSRTRKNLKKKAPATPAEEQEIPTPTESVHVAHQDTDQTSEYVNVPETQHVELPSDDIAMEIDETVRSPDGEAGNQSSGKKRKGRGPRKG